MAKQGSNRNIILAIVGVVLVLCVCMCVIIAGVLAVTGGSVLAIFNAAKPMTDAGDKFMTALRDGNYDAAYKLMDTSLQRKYGSSAKLKQAIETDRLQPTAWSFHSTNINNDTVSLSGDATMKAGAGSVSLDMRKVGETWLVTDFELSPD